MVQENGAKDAKSEEGQMSESAVLEPPVEKSEEVALLSEAVEGFRSKIRWHEGKIAEHRSEIQVHENQIVDLQQTLKGEVGSLMTIAGISMPVPRVERKTNPPVRTRRRNTTSGTTSDLIMSCIKESREAVNTEHVKKYLEERGNHTNPSVELTRLVKKGMVSRPSRGMYAYVKTEDE